MVKRKTAKQKGLDILWRKSNTVCFHKAAATLCGSGWIIAFNLYVFSLSGIGIGIWPQSEIAVTALHGAALLCTCGLLLMARHSILTIRNPLVLIPFAIGLLTIVMLPFVDLPVRSFLGSARTGEGAVWWFDLSMLTASGLILWRLKVWRKILIASAFIGAIVSATLTYIHNHVGGTPAPYYFMDYVAFQLIGLLPVTYLWLSGKIKGWKFYAVFYVLLNLSLWITENKAMIGYGLLLPPFFWALWATFRSSPQAQKRSSIAILALIPCVAFIIFFAIAKLPLGQGYYAYVNSGLFQTVASRAFLIEVSLDSLWHKPSAFITGLGWGTYEDHIARYLPTGWLDIADFKRTQWDGLRDDHFHSHNMFVETLNAIGIMGCIGLLLYMLSFPIVAKRTMQKPAILTSAGFMAWASLWFLFPINQAFLALASISISKGIYPFKKLTKAYISPFSMRTILSIIALMQASAMLMTFSTAWNGNSYEPKGLTPEQAVENCPLEYNDFAAGGLHLSRFILDRVRYTIDITDRDKKPERKEVEGHIRSLNHLFCQADQYVQTHNTNARLKIAKLMARGEILFGLNEYLDEQTKDFYYTGWKHDLNAWLMENPGRSDQAIPYFLYHMEIGQEGRMQETVDLIYKHNSEDPVGLWFKGLSLLSHPHTSAQGIELMRKALKHGIERFMPVEKGLRDMLVSG